MLREAAGEDRVEAGVFERQLADVGTDESNPRHVTRRGRYEIDADRRARCHRLGEAGGDRSRPAAEVEQGHTRP
jgi:hypothetical protein